MCAQPFNSGASSGLVSPRSKAQPSGFLTAVLIAFACIAPAHAEQDTWIGGTGLWNFPKNWSLGVTPDNGLPPFGVYQVTIDGNPNVNSAVTIPTGTAFRVNSVAITAGDSLTLQSGGSLTIPQTTSTNVLENAGALILDSGSTLVVASGLTLDGGGVFDSAGTVNALPTNLQPSPAITIANQTLMGSGVFAPAILMNNGTIQNDSGQTFSVSVQQNAGLIQAVNGGTLKANVSVEANSHGSIIQADPQSTLMLTGAIGAGTVQVIGNGAITGAFGIFGTTSLVNSPTGTITGSNNVSQPFAGTITNPLGGQISLGALGLARGAEVVNSGTLNIGRLQVTTGGDLFNAGTLGLHQLSLSTPFELRGGGRVILGQQFNEAVITENSSAPLINVDQMIQGSGMWLGPFINDATIDANVAAIPLTINPPVVFAGSSVPILDINNGTLRASNGGHLVVSASVAGSGGWVADGGTITFQQSPNILTLGPITVANGGRLEVGPPPKTGSPGTVSGSNLTLDASSSISNQGNITLFGNLSFAMTDASKWTWPAATSSTPGAQLTMDGGTSAVPGTALGWALLELGEKDNGPNGPGYDTSFSIPVLKIGPDSHVLLTDLLDNGNRGGSAGAPEALYVDQLVFSDPSGQIDLNGLHLYYQQLLGGSASQIIDVPVNVPEPGGLPAGIIVTALALARRRCT